MDKHPLTIRLDDALLKVVRVQATLTRSSLGSVVVDAARQPLMPEYQQAQHELVREMLAMFVRTFFRHTPAVKPELQDRARASVAQRFEVFLNALATNRRNRRSVMDPTPRQESAQSSPDPNRDNNDKSAVEAADIQFNKSDKRSGVRGGIG